MMLIDINMHACILLPIIDKDTFNLEKFIRYQYDYGVVQCYNAYSESYKLRGNLWTRVFLIIKRRSYIL